MSDRYILPPQPRRQQTPPGAAPHFKGPYTCEMGFSVAVKVGADLPPQLFAALLARRPDPDGNGHKEIEGNWPRIPVSLVGRSHTHLVIPHALVFEVAPQDIQGVSLFDSVEPGEGVLWCYGGARARLTQHQPERRFEFPAYSVLVRRPRHLRVSSPDVAAAASLKLSQS